MDLLPARYAIPGQEKEELAFPGERRPRHRHMSGSMTYERIYQYDDAEIVPWMLLVAMKGH